MQQYLIAHGIPAEHIILDYAGIDTYDSLYRARDIFGQTELVIFTQRFHLIRALYIADGLGIHAYGFATDYHVYLGATWNEMREILARVKAFLEIEIWRTSPRFLGDTIRIL